ncbi:hypothetical protein FOA52_003522 [Chlamydomonas sp. UWO 241]|nr:hypothetical protein FOA52_003522 [Chlamydomonas sp. UWO 241]
MTPQAAPEATRVEGKGGRGRRDVPEAATHHTGGSRRELKKLSKQQAGSSSSTANSAGATTTTWAAAASRWSPQASAAVAAAAGPRACAPVFALGVAVTLAAQAAYVRLPRHAGVRKLLAFLDFAPPMLPPGGLPLPPLLLGSGGGGSTTQDAGASSSGQHNTGTQTSLDDDDGESVEWVNMCWRKMWRVYQRGLERWIIDMLQPVLDGCTTDGTLPRFVQRLRIVELTLDHDPPYFSHMRRRFSRKDSDLTGVANVRYTGGARMLLMLEIGEGRWRFKVPVLVSDLDLDCKLWIKLRLAPMCPWIGTISLAFVGSPIVKVQLSPYNRVRLMRVPVVQTLLRKLLTEDLPGFMVLPRRLELDIPPSVTSVAEVAVGRDTIMRAVAWRTQADAVEQALLDALPIGAQAPAGSLTQNWPPTNTHAHTHTHTQADAVEQALLDALPIGAQAPAGGISLPDSFRGEVAVTLHAGRNLPVWGFPGQSNPYCVLTFGKQAVRSRKEDETGTKGGHRAPVWNQEFQFLVEDVASQVLTIHVRDSHLTGRVELGSVSIPLSSLPPRSMAMAKSWLPVLPSIEGGPYEGGELLLDVTYKPFLDDDEDSGFREAQLWQSTEGEAGRTAAEEEVAQISDIRSAAAASSRAAVAASAAITAVAMTQAAAARAAMRTRRVATEAAAAAAAAAANAAAAAAAAAGPWGAPQQGQKQGQQEQQQGRKQWQQQQQQQASPTNARVGASGDNGAPPSSSNGAGPPHHAGSRDGDHARADGDGSEESPLHSYDVDAFGWRVPRKGVDAFGRALPSEAEAKAGTQPAQRQQAEAVAAARPATGALTPAERNAADSVLQGARAAAAAVAAREQSAAGATGRGTGGGPSSHSEDPWGSAAGTAGPAGPAGAAGAAGAGGERPEWHYPQQQWQQEQQEQQPHEQPRQLTVHVPSTLPGDNPSSMSDDEDGEPGDADRARSSSGGSSSSESGSVGLFAGVAALARATGWLPWRATQPQEQQQTQGQAHRGADSDGKEQRGADAGGGGGGAAGGGWWVWLPWGGAAAGAAAAESSEAGSTGGGGATDDGEEQEQQQGQQQQQRQKTWWPWLWADRGGRGGGEASESGAETDGGDDRKAPEEQQQQQQGQRPWWPWMWADRGGQESDAAAAGDGSAPGGKATRAGEQQGRPWWQLWGGGTKSTAGAADEAAAAQSAVASGADRKGRGEATQQGRPWWQLWGGEEGDAGASPKDTPDADGAADGSKPVEAIIIPPDLSIEDIAKELAAIKEDSWRRREDHVSRLWGNAVEKNDRSWLMLLCFLLSVAVGLLSLVEYRIDHMVTGVTGAVADAFSVISPVTPPEGLSDGETPAPPLLADDDDGDA